MDEDFGSTNSNSALADRGGQSVTVVIGDKLGKYILASLVVTIVLLAAIGAASYRAELKAENATKTADYSANEFRMTQLWLQRIAARPDCEKLPTIPASLLVK